MGYRLALSGALGALVIAVAGAGPIDGGVIGAEAQAATAHASGAGGGHLASITRVKMNGVRRAHGLRRLRPSRRLSRSARRQARHMAYHGFGHLSTIRASRTFRSLAEIILRHPGGRGRPSTAIAGWLGSSAHRSIMLSGRYRSVGIGSFSRGGVTYWAAHLGRR